MLWYIVAALATVAALAAGYMALRSRSNAVPAMRTPVGPQALVVLSTQTFQVTCVAQAVTAFKAAGFQVPRP